MVGMSNEEFGKIFFKTSWGIRSIFLLEMQEAFANRGICIISSGNVSLYTIDNSYSLISSLSSIPRFRRQPYATAPEHIAHLLALPS